MFLYCTIKVWPFHPDSPNSSKFSPRQSFQFYGRYFLKMVDSRIEPSEQSGIQMHLQKFLALQHFKQLTLKNKIFGKREHDDEDSSDDDGVHIMYNCKPPPRKQHVA